MNTEWNKFLGKEIRGKGKEERIQMEMVCCYKREIDGGIWEQWKVITALIDVTC